MASSALQSPGLSCRLTWPWHAGHGAIGFEVGADGIDLMASSSASRVLAPAVWRPRNIAIVMHGFLPGRCWG